MPYEVRGKTLKSVTVEATFAELKGGDVHQRGRGVGTSVRAAAARAISALLSAPGLKRKRFSTFTAVVSVGAIQTETETVDEEAK